MRFFADFNIHSRYARGTHPDMELPTIVKWAKLKGLALLGTGDFTHPQWRVELKKFLKPASGRGVYEYDDVRFILTGEVVCAYARAGRNYRINHLLFAPNFSAADRIADALGRFGDLETEADPALRLTAEELVQTITEASPDALVVPAHAWGPKHSLFSAQFGYDSLAEAYGKSADQVRVLETGLACDPALARRWGSLDGRALISNSDAHHPAHLGREANMFDCPLDYKDITAALVRNDRSRFLGTVEMFPEEDRFHAAGHRACQALAVRDGSLSCPACGKPCVPGVRDRVEALADRPADSSAGAFYRLIPLQEIVAQAMGFQPEADSVQRQYQQITKAGPELPILVQWTEEELRRSLPPRVADGVLAVRRGDVELKPGYDGLPGRVRVRLPQAAGAGQPELFGD